jgi:cytochrome c oxidase subunit 1
MALGLLLLIGNFVHALFRGKKAEGNPWGGVTLEWKVGSPPPTENFRETPVISGKPYEFNPEADA